jgi:hypothetical protein
MVARELEIAPPHHKARLEHPHGAFPIHNASTLSLVKLLVVQKGPQDELAFVQD